MQPGVGKRALRIVLFGRPGAGKSSLLAALTQAAQDNAAPWALTDVGSGLARLRQQLAEAAPQPTGSQSYPVIFQDRAANGDTSEVLLLDADGSAALQLLGS